MRKKYKRKRGPVQAKKITYDGINFASGLERYMHMALKKNRIRAKYEGESQEITPAEINQNISKKIKDISIDIYKKMNLKGICRIDFILKNKTSYVIEINTIPGMSKESIIPQQIKAADIKMSEVITMSLSNANI